MTIGYNIYSQFCTRKCKNRLYLYWDYNDTTNMNINPMWHCWEFENTKGKVTTRSSAIDQAIHLHLKYLSKTFDKQKKICFAQAQISQRHSMHKNIFLYYFSFQTKFQLQSEKKSFHDSSQQKCFTNVLQFLVLQNHTKSS